MLANFTSFVYNYDMTILRFQKFILNWYKTNRRELPWRNTFDPYKILVSEIMLQQTQISRVLPKYKEFLKAFPTLSILARARDKRLLKVWQGLGYWRRAKYLKETAKIVVKKNTIFSKPEYLEKLPGIGHYTARAIACFAFQNTEAFLDTNIRRVYLHFFFPKRQNVADSEILPIAQKAVWQKNSREWHYALFDYGAMVLKDKKINKQSKHYRKQSKFEGSFRSFRTKVVKFLLLQPKNKATQKTIESFLRKELARQKSRHAVSEIVGSLLKDNLIKKSSTSYSL